MEYGKQAQRLFIGSSSKQIKVAYELQAILDKSCVATVWNLEALEPTESILDRLTRDSISPISGSSSSVRMTAMSKGEGYQTPRDNVVFELGLFIGRLGEDEDLFPFPAERADLKLPSDLDDPVADVRRKADRGCRRERRADPACNPIRKRIELKGIRPERVQQPLVDKVPIESVLCLTSEPYEQLDVQADIKTLEKYFPGKVRIQNAI